MGPSFTDRGLNVPVDHHRLEMVMPRPVTANGPDQFVIPLLQTIELPVQIIDSPLDIAAARLALAQCQPPACAPLAKGWYQRRAALSSPEAPAASWLSKSVSPKALRRGAHRNIPVPQRRPKSVSQ